MWHHPEVHGGALWEIREQEVNRSLRLLEVTAIDLKKSSIFADNSESIKYSALVMMIMIMMNFFLRGLSIFCLI